MARASSSMPRISHGELSSEVQEKAVVRSALSFGEIDQSWANHRSAASFAPTGSRIVLSTAMRQFIPTGENARVSSTVRSKETGKRNTS